MSAYKKRIVDEEDEDDSVLPLKRRRKAVMDEDEEVRLHTLVLLWSAKASFHPAHTRSALSDPKIAPHCSCSHSRRPTPRCKARPPAHLPTAAHPPRALPPTG